MAKKRLRPEDYIPGPIRTGHPPDGTARWGGRGVDISFNATLFVPFGSYY